MRTFGLSEFLFIVQAAQWTLALSAIAFVGGALLGLVVALSPGCQRNRVSVIWLAPIVGRRLRNVRANAPIRPRFVGCRSV